MAKNLRASIKQSIKASSKASLTGGNVFGSSPLDLRFALQKTLDPRVTFTRASTGTYVGGDGTLRSAVTNEARFDHNPTTGESLGLLVEEARTNLLLRSEEFDATWTPTALQAFGSGSIANAIAAPNGSITADLITENTANSEHNVLQAITVTVNTTYTLSCFAKKGTRSILVMSPTSPGVANYYTLFNLDTGAIVFNETGNTSTITALGNGWYRCSITRTTGAAQVLSNNKIGIANNALSTTYTGDGTSGLYVWGAQLEQGAFPTSYIPTTSATVTRAADVASITGTNFSSFYNQAEGTVLFNCRSAPVNNIAQFSYDISNGTTNERIFSRRNASGLIATTMVDNGVTQGGADLVVGTVIAASAAYTSAYSYAANNLNLVINGSSPSSFTTASTPTVDRLNIGQNFSSTQTINGTIKRLTYWPTRLPNPTLQAITQP